MVWAKGKPFPHGEVAYASLTKDEKLAYMRKANRAYYLKKVGALVRNMHHTPESRREWSSTKSTIRATRAKQARVLWEKELTDFVYREAHALRKLRNSLFGFEWHVDHIIPLRGKDVCGLHIWRNFAVIPKVENLRKGNKNSIHEERPPELQSGTSVGA
jgi:hypothetical protein